MKTPINAANSAARMSGLFLTPLLSPAQTVGQTQSLPAPSDGPFQPRACLEVAAGDTLGMNDEVAERFNRLESAVAHLELLTEQLNEVVTGQARQIDRLNAKVRLQAQSLETIELERIRSTNPKPPHYQ
jgi:uncharacterized coiled-coil protein SlyX